jgi:recombination protein RecA
MVKKKEEVQEEVAATESSGDKALQLTLGAIEKDFGKGTVLFGEGVVPGVEFSPSGCLSVDRALGGGYPRGRIIEIYGPESSGKTTLAIHAMVEMQKLGENVAFIDAEHSFDSGYATDLGLDCNRIIFSQPKNGEECLEVTKRLVNSGTIGLGVIDSVAALVPQKELEGAVGDAQMGAQARLMSQAMRMLTGACLRTNTTLIFINQMRMKIGVMFGNPETTTGGNALKFYASQRVDIRRTGGIKEGETLVANSIRVKVVKSKVSMPFREAEFNIIYGKGIDVWSDLLKVAVADNIVEKSGAWYSFKGEKIGQGEANAATFLKDNQPIATQIREALHG